MGPGTGHPEFSVVLRGEGPSPSPLDAGRASGSGISNRVGADVHGLGEDGVGALLDEAWDYDLDNSHDPLNVAGSNSTALTYATGDYIGWSPSFTLTGTTSPRGVSRSIHVSTVTPTRNPVFLVLPDDYFGVFNVTDSAGTILSRRYVGEPRLVALVLNVTSPSGWTCITPDGCDDAPIGEKVLFVPREVFHGTFLGKKLAGGNRSQIPDNLVFYQNGTDPNESNSAVLQQVIAGNVTAEEYFRILGWLLRNATDNATNRILNVTGDLFLYSFPPLPRPPITRVEKAMSRSGMPCEAGSGGDLRTRPRQGSKESSTKLLISAGGE